MSGGLCWADRGASKSLANERVVPTGISSDPAERLALLNKLKIAGTGGSLHHEAQQSGATSDTQMFDNRDHDQDDGGCHRLDLAGWLPLQAFIL
jgi:hypothetical protein